MTNVWIQIANNDLLRADAFIHLQLHSDGLEAHCLDGRSVRITDSSCPANFHLALLSEIARSAIDDRKVVILTADASENGTVWRRNFVDDLLEESP